MTQPITDAHVHARGELTTESVRAWLKNTGISVCHLFSSGPLDAADGGRVAISNLAAVARDLPDQVRPLAIINPLHPEAPAIARWAVTECGMLGFKMLPVGWYPEDPRAQAVYAVAQELDVPIQFHSGILWIEGDNSRYNRPAGYEVLWNYPGVRFSLAHIGWPWTDECIAVVQKFKVLNRRHPQRDPYQAMVDLTPGTPPIYRRDALMKCLACLGPDFLIYGSDSGIPHNHLPEGKWESDRALLAELGCGPDDLAKIAAANAARLLATRDRHRPSIKQNSATSDV